jgi:hypothetical protein
VRAEAIDRFAVQAFNDARYAVMDRASFPGKDADDDPSISSSSHLLEH